MGTQRVASSTTGFRFGQLFTLIVGPEARASQHPKNSAATSAYLTRATRRAVDTEGHTLVDDVAGHTWVNRTCRRTQGRRRTSG
jgi:hypothetical protein